MEHELKIEEPYAEAILSGDKTFEVRFNDRGYQKGDTIRFIAVSSFVGAAAIEGKLFLITYVLTHPLLSEGAVVLAIKEIKEHDQ